MYSKELLKKYGLISLPGLKHVELKNTPKGLTIATCDENNRVLWIDNVHDALTSAFPRSKRVYEQGKYPSTETTKLVKEAGLHF